METTGVCPPTGRADELVLDTLTPWTPCLEDKRGGRYQSGNDVWVEASLSIRASEVHVETTAGCSPTTGRADGPVLETMSEWTPCRKAREVDDGDVETHVAWKPR